MKKELVLFLLIVLGFGVYFSQGYFEGFIDSPLDDKPIEVDLNQSSFRVANWNLQIFGDSKASNETLMDFYVSVIDDYDIIFIQEIRDSDGSSFVELCGKLNNYNCINSSRAGRSSSKEQYGVIFKEGILVSDFIDYNPDTLDRWERPPIFVEFNVSGELFGFYNIHTKPDDVPSEMNYLEELIDSKRFIILGDLNADCSYYDNSKENHFDSLNWIISDEIDTTVSNTDCAYDRIISSEIEVISFGVYREGIDKEVSDHYLVWAEIPL